MLGVQIHWEGNTHFVRDMLDRADTGRIQREILTPWMAWVLKYRIPEMYRRGGKLSGKDGSFDGWKALSPWTKEAKGKVGSAGGINAFAPMLSARGYSSKSMVRNYDLKMERRGAKDWLFKITNKARSEKGFDYPSALHRGWPEYTVRPVKAKALAWPIQGGAWNVYQETHPGPAPARPHIKFFWVDVNKLGKTAVDWVLTGDRPSSGMALGVKL